MSLFNNVFGFISEAALLLNILGMEPDTIPRFRDCFYDTEEHRIVIHTRTGGGNREEYEEENQEMTCHPHYLEDSDDDFDSTYANFYYSVPEEYSDKLKEAFKDRKTITPADKWESLFKAMNNVNPKG